MTDLCQITIISGGQTGADRAAVDFAIEHAIPHDGWCPRGRLAEDGPLAARYSLRETPSRKYAERTEWNVRDSDATVVFTIAPQVTGGTALTLACARRLGKPALHLARSEYGATPVDGANSADLTAIAIEAATNLRRFLAEHDVHRLNVAGPRASQEPEVAEFVRCVLRLACRA